MKNPDLFPYYFKDEANDFAKRNGRTDFYLIYNPTLKVQEQFFEFARPLESVSYLDLRRDAERQGVTFLFMGYKTHCLINANEFSFHCSNSESSISSAIKIMKFCGIIE